MPSLLSQLALATVITTAPVINTPPPIPTLSDYDNTASYQAQEDAVAVTNSNDNRVPVGIDVSSHQHTITSMDMKKVAGNQQDFVFIKATEGTEYINPYFRVDTIGAIESNTVVGFYHYARPSKDVNDAREQARHFIRVTGLDVGVKSLPPVLDIEEDAGLTPEELSRWVSAFVEEIKTQLNRDTMIYTYPIFWQQKMANTDKFSHLPLWIAHYNDSDMPGSLPGGWEKWSFWQYTSSGVIDGISGKVDQNVFSGSLDNLYQLYSTSFGDRVEDSVPTPPKITVSTTEGDTLPLSLSSRLPELKTLLRTFEESKG